MTDYAAVLAANYPDSAWTLDGDDYSGLTWIGPGSKPTQQELDDAWPAVQQARAQAAVDAQRQAAYVAESDPLFFKWQRGETTEQAWLDKIAEIQARFPDPQAGS